MNTAVHSSFPSAPDLSRQDMAIIACAALGYFAAHHMAFLFPDTEKILMAIWPAGGIGLASLLLSPRRLWPPILVALFAAGNVANLMAERPLFNSIGFMTANVLESLACAYVIIRWCGRPVRFSRVKEVVALIFGAVIVNAVTALVGSGTAKLAGMAPFWEFWETWYVADGLGILLVTPLIVNWSSFGHVSLRNRWPRLLESLLFTSVWGAVAWMAFAVHAELNPLTVRPYICLALLSWAALRLGQRWVILALGILAFIALTSDAVNVGPLLWGGDSRTERVLLTQVYLACTAITGLLLGASCAESKASERSAIEEQARIRSLGDNLPNGVVFQAVTEKSGRLRFLYLSAGLERLIGITPEEAIRDASAFLRQIVEEDRSVIAAAQDASARNLTPFNTVLRLSTPDNRLRWLHLSSSPRRMTDGRTVWDGVLMDITDLKEAEEKIKVQNAFLEQVLESLTHPFCVVNTIDYTIEKANSAAVSRGITVNSHCYAVAHQRKEPCDGSDHPCPLAEAKRSGMPVTVEHIHYDEKGDASNVEIHFFPIKELGGSQERGIQYILDITDRKKAQEVLVQAEKSRAVADLTSGVAHNFNNLLQIVIGNAALAQLNIQSGDLDNVRENIDQIIKSSKFGAETVKRLNRYARGGSPGKAAPNQVFDLSELVIQAVDMSRPWWNTEPERKGIEIIMDCRLKSGSTIRGDKGDMFEVVVNLLKNAVDALPAGGGIEINTGLEDDRVVFRIHDTGIGIPKENLNRLFTPFFTTNLEAGRGLGLATCRRIVEAHSGTIVAESEEGKGSTFTISFPLVLEQPDQPAIKSQDEQANALSILVADDVEATVKVLKEGIERLGHTVLTALTGEEALTIIRDMEVDLIICDLGMPSINGLRVAETVKSIYREKGIPKPPFVILTGWDHSVQEEDQWAERGVDAVVKKPAEVTALMKVGQEVLQRGRS